MGVGRSDLDCLPLGVQSFPFDFLALLFDLCEDSVSDRIERGDRPGVFRFGWGDSLFDLDFAPLLVDMHGDSVSDSMDLRKARPGRLDASGVLFDLLLLLLLQVYSLALLEREDRPGPPFFGFGGSDDNNRLDKYWWRIPSAPVFFSTGFVLALEELSLDLDRREGLPGPLFG